MLSPTLSPSTSTTDRGSRMARLFPHFATCMMTSRIYGVYNVYPSRDTRIFQGWDELASWFRRLKPNPDPAFHVVVEETNPGLFKGLIGYASGSTRSRGRPGLPSN